MAAPISFSRWFGRSSAPRSLFEYELPSRFEKHAAIFIRLHPDHARIRFAVGHMKPLRQRRVGLSDGLANVLAPTVSVGLDSHLLKFGVSRFKTVFRRIKLNLPSDGDLPF